MRVQILNLLLCMTPIFFTSCGNLGVMSFDGDSCEGYTPAALSPYRLPYRVGQTYEVWQGNCGAVSHHGIARFAYDLLITEGIDIIAMRGGTVFFVTMKIKDGSYGAEYNEIHIRHDEGSIAQYIHLQQASASVVEGQVVAQGDVIARAGSSGTTLPHLHIAILPSDKAHGVTIPFNFSNALSNDWGLIAEKAYQALE